MNHYRQWTFNPEYLWTITGCILYLLLILVPLLVLVYQSTDAGWEVFVQTVIPRGRQGGLFLNSLMLSAVVAAAGTVLATFTALWLYTRQHRLAAMVKWLFLFMLLIPAYIHTMAWGSVIHTINTVLSSLNLRIMEIGGWIACGWVEVMYLLPLGVGMVLLGLSAVDGRLIEAGMVMQPPHHVWKKVVIPMLYPVISLSAALLFLLTFIDYSIPSLFQISTYALEIFAEFSYSNDPGRVLATAVPLLLITSLVLVSSQNVIRRAVMKPRRNRSRNLRLLEWPQEHTWIQGMVIISLLLQVGVPFAVIINQIGDVQVFLASVISSGQEIWFSIKVAAATSIISMLLALAVALYLLQRPKSGAWLIGLSTMPLALPASLTGISLITIFSSSAMETFYNGLMLPVLAPLIRFTPLAVLVLVAYLTRINPLYFEAASVLQRRPGQAFARVFLPLALPGMIAAAVLVFAFTAGELGATLMVAPPGMATLTMKIYNYLHYGASAEVASLCLTMLIFTAMLVLMAVMVINKFFYRTARFQEESQQ